MTANLTTKTMKMRRKRLLLLPKAARSKASRGACLLEPMVVTEQRHESLHFSHFLNSGGASKGKLGAEAPPECKQQ